MSNPIDDVTAVIKTFERPLRLNRLVESIKNFYPGMRIIVADDSREPMARKDVEYHKMPYDQGLSAGRNFLISKVKTKYFLLLDDDWVFVPETRIQVMIDILENNDIDILAGDWSNSQPTICAVFVPNEDPSVLELASKEVERDKDFTYCDFTHNFLLSTPGAIRKFGGWDEEIKVLEHIDFALRVKKSKRRLALTHKSAIHFTQTLVTNEDSVDYKAHRRRKHFMELSMRKRGIRTFKNFTGRTKHYE
jgi:glycosyltransferase involved in cell wall biosynthesis